MIKYLVKRTVKNEMLENSKKIAFYTGIAAVSTVGGYISYKAIKKMRSRKEDEIEYLEYEEYDSDDLENELEKDELKEKVEEFNSRRICHENCEDASPGEIEKHINSIKDDKENMKKDKDYARVRFFDKINLVKYKRYFTRFILIRVNIQKIIKITIM